MTLHFLFIGFLVILALGFDFINGFHDAANSVATIVGTRVLTPKQAVIWAAFFNFIAAFVFKLHVATTMGKGIIDPHIVDTWVVFGALMGAIVWDLVTWYWGLPTSSSHALIGGLVGAALAKVQTFSVLIWAGIIKVTIFILIAPLVGLILGFVLSTIINFLFAGSKPMRVDKNFRRFQLVSAALYSLGHGGNDAQKTMGIITMLLFSAGYLGSVFHVPLWVILFCHFSMAMGTMLGGWRIIKTMSVRITELKPSGGFCAETSAALSLFGATALGVPVSTTHTITGAIVGVGATHGLGAVQWSVASRIVWAWVVTIPASALIAALAYAMARSAAYFV